MASSRRGRHPFHLGPHDDVKAVARVGTFDLRRWRHVIVAAAGALVMSVMLARGFGRFYGGL